MYRFELPDKKSSKKHVSEIDKYLNQEQESRKEKFFEYLKKNKETMRDMVYLIYNFIEPKYQESLQQLREKVESHLISLLSTISIENNFDFSTDDGLEAAAEVIYDYYNNLSEKNTLQLNILATKTSELKLARSLYYNLKSFDIHEFSLLNVSNEKFEALDLYQKLVSFCVNAASMYKDRSPEKPAVKKQFGYVSAHSMKDVFNTLTQLHNSQIGHTLDKLSKPLQAYQYRTKSNDIYVQQVNEFYTSYSLTNNAFEKVLSRAKNLTVQDKKIINIVRNTKINEDYVSFILDVSPDSEGSVYNYQDKIFKNVYFNVWVKLNVEKELEEIITSEDIIDKEVLKSLEKERTSFYKKRFYELDTPWKKEIVEKDEALSYSKPLEETSVDSEIIFSNDTNDFTLSDYVKYQPYIHEKSNEEDDTYDITNYLNSQDFLQVKNIISEEKIGRLNNIISFVEENKESCAKSFGIVSHHMKFKGLSPFDHQFGDMKFGGRNYPNSIKLNITVGDRIVLYFDQNNNLAAEYMTAAEYHRDRKK